jgi:signal transduction histidine kinase
MQRAAAITAADRLASEVQISLLAPGTEPAVGIEHLLPAGPKMPGWRLALTLGDGAAWDVATSRRIAVNTWIATLVIAAMAIVALLVAAVLRRQMRLTRLKNDLLATVSHELKTPLASMRLLVDTLLDAERLDVPQVHDYLRLIAKENARLSHLIDNFLSFSRMERNRQAFAFAEVPAAEVVHRATEVVAERFQAPGCRLEVQLAPDLPRLWADLDALVTAVLNLLDNAHKYTGDRKHVVLRAGAEQGHVCLAVSDNGVGLSPGAMKKVFRPFYQVDRRLSRGTGGCGLGLSIVQFIAAAHGGTVRVESQPGVGSTFTLSIPQFRG